MDKKIQEIARNLLAEGKVDIVIGYAEGYDAFHTRVAFISNVEDVGKLIFNQYCTQNLAVYLPMYKKLRIGIAAKACDLSSIRELIKQHQIVEENVVVIEAEGTNPHPIPLTSGEGQRHKNTKDDAPVAADELEKLSAKERGEFWDREFERCIRCYACRQACPVCYCPDCFSQRSMPEYLNTKAAGQENKLFQIIRMYHVFGRCTDCRACENACPMGIPLGLLTRKITQDAEELFGYTSGQGQEHPFATFKKDELLEGL